MLRKRSMMVTAAPTGVTLEWGTLTGSASSALYNKERPITITNHTTGTLTINISIELTRPYSDSAKATITKYTGSTPTVIANNVAIPYSTTTSITITPGQFAGLRIYAVDSDSEHASWENLYGTMQITGGTLSGQTVTVGSNYRWYLE